MKRKANRNTLRGRLMAGASGVVFAMASPAMAQSGEVSRDFDQIVVTASKTGETLLQRTPIAITALSADELEYSYVTQLDEIALRVPGMFTGGTTGFGMPLTLRGITSRTTGVGVDPAISVYVDGVPFGRSLGTALDLIDIEQIEVLRGPQGTLWGRNSIGGAVSIRTRRPSGEFGAYLEGSYGNFDQRRIRGSIEGPVVADKVAANLTYSDFRRDGFQENTADDRDLNNRVSRTFRGSVLLTPSDDLEITFSGDWAVNNTRLAFGTITPGVIADPDVVSVSADNRFDTEQSGLSATIEYDLGAFGQFTSVTAFRDYKTNLVSDSDSTALDLVEFLSLESANQFSQELRLNGAVSDRFQWLFGLHYFRETAEIDFGVFNLVVDPTTPVLETFSQTETKSYAAFGQGQYNLTDNLRLSAGLRYTYDRKDLNFNSTFVGQASDDGTSRVLTPRFVLDYQATDDLLVYASASRGYNAGGFTFSSSQDFFDPEFVWAYELGFKSVFAGGRGLLNVAGFYADYTDLQVTTTTQIGVDETQNAATAEIYGAEAEFSLRLFDNFELMASAAYTQAKFLEFLREFPNGDVVDNAGNLIQRAPEWTTNVIAAYTEDLSDFGTLRLQGEYSYVGRLFFNSDNNPLSEGGRYSLFNASATLEIDDSQWFVSLFGKNLSNEREIDAFTQPGAGSSLVLYIPPRTYGVRVGLRI